jgi:hypothetical protein
MGHLRIEHQNQIVERYYHHLSIKDDDVVHRDIEHHKYVEYSASHPGEYIPKKRWYISS